MFFYKKLSFVYFILLTNLIYGFGYKSFKDSTNDVHYLSNTKLEKKLPYFVAELYEKNVEKLKNDFIVQNKIPKIIHFIWIGGELPCYLNFCINSWKKLHPEWQIILWDDLRVGGFKLQNQFIYDAVVNVGSKVDILRLEILKQMGGVYVDTDFFCLKPIDILTDMEYFNSSESIGNTLINNGIIGCIPNHYIINDMLNELSSGMISNKNIDNVLELAGPLFITNFFIRKYMDNKSYFSENVLILPPSYFCSFPFKLRSRFWDNEIFLCDLIEEYTLAESFAVHLWNNSWIKVRDNRTLDFLNNLNLITKSTKINDLINATDENGMTPLLIATINNYKTEIEGLLRNGASINLVDNDGLSIIDYAKKNGIQYLFAPYL